MKVFILFSMARDGLIGLPRLGVFNFSIGLVKHLLMVLGVIVRDCQGFWNPPGVRGRVSEGNSMGWDFHTLTKPLPSAGVKGIDNYKNIHLFTPKEVFLFLKTLFLAYNRL